MIKFNDRFSADRDANGWTLTEYKRYTKKDGTPAVSEQYRYYGKFEHVCQEVIDLMCGECEDVKQVLVMLEKAAQGLVESCGQSSGE